MPQEQHCLNPTPPQLLGITVTRAAVSAYMAERGQEQGQAVSISYVTAAVRALCALHRWKWKSLLSNWGILKVGKR